MGKATKFSSEADIHRFKETNYASTFCTFVHSTEKIRLRMTCVVEWQYPKLRKAFMNALIKGFDLQVFAKVYHPPVPPPRWGAQPFVSICDIRLVVTSDDSQHG